MFLDKVDFTAKVDPEPEKVTTVVGQIPSGHLTTISVFSAKVTIKMVILSNYYFGKNLWCTFTQSNTE